MNDNAQVIEDVAGRRGGGGDDVPADVRVGGGARMRFTFTHRETGRGLRSLSDISVRNRTERQGVRRSAGANSQGQVEIQG